MKTKKAPATKKAEFIKDHVFFLKGVRRSICAKQFQKLKRKIEIPLNYWEDFALKGIVKATDAQLKSLQKKLKRIETTNGKNS